MMDQCMDEQVAVWVAESGAPKRFEWSGHAYIVCGKPVPWVDQTPWWSVACEKPPAHTPIEQAMWTVRAIRVDSEALVMVDLAVMTGDWWRLTRIDE